MTMTRRSSNADLIRDLRRLAVQIDDAPVASVWQRELVRQFDAKLRKLMDRQRVVPRTIASLAAEAGDRHHTVTVLEAALQNETGALNYGSEWGSA